MKFTHAMQHQCAATSNTIAWATHWPTLGVNAHLVQNTTLTFCSLHFFSWKKSMWTDLTDRCILGRIPKRFVIWYSRFFTRTCKLIITAATLATSQHNWITISDRLIQVGLGKSSWPGSVYLGLVSEFLDIYRHWYNFSEYLSRKCLSGPVSWNGTHIFVTARILASMTTK